MCEPDISFVSCFLYSRQRFFPFDRQHLSRGYCCTLSFVLFFFFFLIYLAWHDLTWRLRFPFWRFVLARGKNRMHSRNLLVNEPTGLRGNVRRGWSRWEMGRKRERETAGERERITGIRRTGAKNSCVARGLGGSATGRERGMIEWERNRKKRECGGTIVDSESHLASRLLFIVPCYSGFPRQSGRDAVKKINK